MQPTVAADRHGHEPKHPGAMPREDVLLALGLPVLCAAEALGVSRQALHASLAERAWLQLRTQQAHDLWQAEQALAEAAKWRSHLRGIAAIPTLRAPAA